jgi:hypothetical protein
LLARDNVCPARAPPVCRPRHCHCCEPKDGVVEGVGLFDGVFDAVGAGAPSERLL